MRSRIPWGACVALFLGNVTAAAAADAASPGRAAALGPLHVHPTNPRNFATPDGRAVLLTGSHTWATVQDIGALVAPDPVTGDAVLLLQRRR
jgi:hypothetical protein